MPIPNLSRIAVGHRSVTLFFLLLSIIGGAYAFVSLGRAEDPSFTVRVLMVSAEWPGATVQEMQGQVVDRLEKRIQEVENLYRIETSVRPGRAHRGFDPVEVFDLLYPLLEPIDDLALHFLHGRARPLGRHHQYAYGKRRVFGPAQRNEGIGAADDR